MRCPVCEEWSFASDCAACFKLFQEDIANKKFPSQLDDIKDYLTQWLFVYDDWAQLRISEKSSKRIIAKTAPRIKKVSIIKSRSATERERNVRQKMIAACYKTHFHDKIMRIVKENEICARVRRRYEVFVKTGHDVNYRPSEEEKRQTRIKKIRLRYSY